jgi:hypothetical protein
MPHSREHRSQGCVTVSAAPGRGFARAQATATGRRHVRAVAIEEIFEP